MKAGSSLVLAGSILCLCLSPGVRGQRQFEDQLVKRYLPAAADNPWAMALGDVDGDTDLDLVIGNGSSSGGEQNRLYLNDGRGSFTDATAGRMPVDADVTLSVLLGDVDGDTDLDLIVGNSGGSAQNRLYLNDGTGRFTDATAGQMPADNDSTTALALGDVDGDMDVDLVLGNGGGPNRLYLNDAAGRFTSAPAKMPSNATSTGALALGDVDGDSDLDIVVGNSGSNLLQRQNRLYLNNGNGDFTDVTEDRMPWALHITAAIALGDVDGDSDLDIVVGNGNWFGYQQRTRLHLNDGTGVFTDVTAARMPTVIDQTEAMVLVDVDGDTDLDIVLGNAAEQNRLYLNNGAGTFFDATAELMPKDDDNTFAMAVGDADGDSAPDLVFGNLGTREQNRLYLNDGGGKFVSATASRLPPNSDRTRAVALGDVDGDNDVDLVIGNEIQSSQNQLYLNDGKGGFTDASAGRLPRSGSDTAAVLLGDVDGDADLDLVVGNAGQSRLYRNDGTGTFSDVTATHLPARTIRTEALALGDVDGDDDLDLILGNGGFLLQQNRLYLNDGTGTFTDVTAERLPLVARGDQTLAVALGDVDGDADLDLVIGNQGQQNLLYLNDGTGTFTDATAGRLPLAVDNTYSVVLGDVDGDTDLDIVTGEFGQNHLLLNDGDGTFTDVTAAQLPVDANATTELALGDVDRDGDLDLALGNFAFAQNRLYLNDGTGVFVDATTARMPVDSDDTDALALADVDGDHDLDIVLGNSRRNLLYTNLHRQLSAPVFPALSQTYDLEFHASPGYATTQHAATPVLGLELLPTPIPLRPLGTLYVLPAPVRPPAVRIPAETGVAVYRLTIPGNSSLLGIALYVQGFIVHEAPGGEAHLTGYTMDVIRK